MIPPHRPAFGIGTVVAAALWPRSETRELRRCEELHASAAGCAQAVWLPSARAGIAWGLRAAISPDTHVVGPAYTCSVVHEAMARSGGHARIIDAASDSFAMDREALRAACAGNYALVLSEPFGHPYELGQLENGAIGAPRIRIVDSAMAVPHPSVFSRIVGNDFAVISFGAGKNSYAGWGAMGYTRSPALADEVRRLRDRTLTAGGFKLSWQRGFAIGLRTAAQNPLVFSVTRKLWYQLKKLRTRSQPEVSDTNARQGFPAAWADDGTCGLEWRLPSTQVDRALALRNLELSEAVHAKRLMLARCYHENLTGVLGLLLPPVSPFALSHFTVRLDARIRDRVKELLYQRGVYTISLWAFNAHLSPQDFPNAYRLCSEVICLPLSPWMSAAQVTAACAQLRRCLAMCAQ